MRREQIYWIAVAAAAAGLLCIYAFWVRPVRVRIQQQTSALQEKEALLDLLAKGVEGLPPEMSVNERQAYKDWVKSELDGKVEPFFAALAANLNAPLLTAEGRVADTPEEFKAAYQTRYVEARKELEQAGAIGATLKQGYSRYGWVEGASLPSAKSFREITFDFNLRNALLHLIAECRPIKVKNFSLSIDPKQTRTVQGFGRAIPVSLGLTVPPERVMDVMQTLLSAANRQDAGALAIFIQGVSIQKEAGAAPVVSLDLKFEVMDFSGVVGEKAAAPAPKAAPSGRSGS